MSRHDKQIATIDCETDPFKYKRFPTPFVWGFYDGRNFKYFYDTHEFINYISQFNGIIYAHNGGKFDYHFILDSIPSQTKVTVINGRIAKLRLGKAELRDSYNILPVPLKAMQKDDFEYWKLEKEFRKRYMPEILQYLKGDCVYLHEHIRNFIAKFGLHLTQASGAFKIWHDMAKIKKPVFIGEKGAAYYDKFSPFYYGGRVTPFNNGVFHDYFTMIDINSAYPTAMTSDHPYGYKHIVGKNPPDNKLHLSVMQVQGESFGAFPLRSEKGNKLDFPHAKGIFNITGHEFKTAIKTNTFKCEKIIKSWTFTETINFTEYVKFFHKMKQDCEKSGDKAGRLFAKLFLNSLYGKYCANPRKYTEDVFVDCWPEIDEIEYLKENGFEKGVYLGNNRLWSRKIPPEKWHFHNIITGASITGQVRAFLWDSIQKVDSPMYCDTDSIICKNVGSLELGNNLGEWAVEMTGNKLAIAGKKMYCLWGNDGKSKLACKGARLEPNEIERLANGEEIIYRQDAPTYSLTKGVRHLKRKINKTV